MSTVQTVKKTRGRPRKVETTGVMTVAQAGQLGGSAVAQKYGSEFFQAIGEKGGIIRGLRNEERSLHDKLYSEGRVPQEYIAVRDEAIAKTEQYRMIATTYIDRLYNTVKGRMQPLEIKALVFWDASQIWTERRVHQVFASHPELKTLLDERKQKAGELGGEATAEKIQDANQDIVDAEAGTSVEEVSSAETISATKGAKPTPQLVGSITLDLSKLESELMTSIVQAKAKGSNKIDISFDSEGNAVRVKAI